MDIESAIQAVDHAAKQDDRWLFLALLLMGILTMALLARYFVRQIAARQGEIASVRTDFETHLKSANAEMVAALTKSSEVIPHNSTVLEQIQRRLAG